jgi:hypothetical protein
MTKLHIWIYHIKVQRETQYYGQVLHYIKYSVIKLCKKFFSPIK